MTQKALVPVSTGFEEIEATTIIDVLRRAGVSVTIAGLENEKLVQGRSKIHIQPDCSLDAALKTGPYDMVVLPGGQPNARNLTNDQRILDVLVKTNAEGGIVAAICAAPAALAQAGLLRNRKATIFPGCESDLPSNCYQHQDIVISDGVITSRGPGTAMAFSLALVQALCGDAIAQKVSDALLAPQ